MFWRLVSGNRQALSAREDGFRAVPDSQRTRAAHEPVEGAARPPAAPGRACLAPAAGR